MLDISRNILENWNRKLIRSNRSRKVHEVSSRMVSRLPPLVLPARRHPFPHLLETLTAVGPLIDLTIILPLLEEVRLQVTMGFLLAPRRRCHPTYMGWGERQESFHYLLRRSRDMIDAKVRVAVLSRDRDCFEHLVTPSRLRWIVVSRDYGVLAFHRFWKRVTRLGALPWPMQLIIVLRVLAKVRYLARQVILETTLKMELEHRDGKWQRMRPRVVRRTLEWWKFPQVLVKVILHLMLSHDCGSLCNSMTRKLLVQLGYPPWGHRQVMRAQHLLLRRPTVRCGPRRWYLLSMMTVSMWTRIWIKILSGPRNLISIQFLYVIFEKESVKETTTMKNSEI